MKTQKRHTTSKVLLNLLCILLCVVIFAPLVWIVLNSLKTNRELFTNSLALPAVLSIGSFTSPPRSSAFRM